MSECMTCTLTARRDTGDVPIREKIYRTDYWDVAHAYNTALPGWLVLVARRHLAAVDELTEAEALELGALIRRVSLALKQVTGCPKTYVIQFAEAPQHSHVHFHVIPRMADQPEDHQGPNIFKYLGVAEAEQVSDAEMDRIARDVQRHLTEMRTGAVL